MTMAKLIFLTLRKANSSLLAFLLFASPLGFAQGNAPADNQAAPQEVPNQVPQQAPQEIPQDARDATASEATRVLLARLAQAVANLEYRGLVTFEHVGSMETLEVVHGIRDGEQIERIRYLTGSPREKVTRSGDDQCRPSGSVFPRSGLLSAAGLQNVQSNYAFLIRGEERVADREAIVLEARPRDLHRFGMVISVDKETGLPLKSMLIAPAGRVLERFQFVELDLTPVTDDELKPQTPSTEPTTGAEAAKCANVESRWRLGWAPSGFKPVAVQALSDGQMLVFSDGLSAFTVFVQQLPEMNYKGRAVRGATVAYMDHIDVNGARYTVTVVGEIPDNTAQLVAKAVTEAN
ncbi:MucB/RseB C-terminal domain-containing protein [Microbulbifer agarilyticus]|uniref:MucB/RseB C-terminal domain-containing protein n=1 Tax=Microbulbifer agarilyticus TaxID=260552 RepID=UPI001CD2EF80|nr:MucB/RseB C-terminal domain-containing protein [Microbulbifer agarilyticus]MCA0892291.1 MucB/RseB C-terminal domain-containing protein [Microbulbifer agarilyticus]